VLNQKRKVSAQGKIWHQKQRRRLPENAMQQSFCKAKFSGSLLFCFIMLLKQLSM